MDIDYMGSVVLDDLRKGKEDCLEQKKVFKK